MLRFNSLEADIGSRSRFKNIFGIDDLAFGYLGSAAAGLLGSLFGSSSSEHQNEENIEAQREENERNRQWQSAEWTRQFNMTNEFNNPKAVVSRLQNAGINPSALVGNTGSQVATSKALPSAPSGGHQLTPQMVDYSGFFNTASQFPKHIAEALRLAKETERIDKELPYISDRIKAETSKILADASLSDERAKNEQFQNKMNQIFGYEMRSKELSKLTRDIAVSDANVRLADSEVSLNAFKGWREQSEALLSYSRKHLTDNDAKLLEIELKYREKELQTRLGLMRAQTTEAHANAAHSSALAASENAIREYKVTIASDEAKLKTETHVHRMEQIWNEAEQSGVLTDQMKIALNGMKYADSLKEFTYWYNRYLGFLNGARDVAGSAAVMAAP